MLHARWVALGKGACSVRGKLRISSVLMAIRGASTNAFPAARSLSVVAAFPSGMMDAAGSLCKDENTSAAESQSPQYSTAVLILDVPVEST